MPRSRVPWWMGLCALSFLGYFLVLIYCDVWRPESEGLLLAPGPTALVVQQVVPGSAAARAGLRPGDEVLVAGGHPVASRFAWTAVEDNVRFDRPLELVVRRGDARVEAALQMVPVPWQHWTTREGVELVVSRLAQLVTLVLGLIVAFRRPADRDARLGGWLLASFGVFCVVLPYRIADVWRGLPAPVSAVLWLPYVSSLAIPGLLLSFFTTFPRRSLRFPLAWAAVWLPLLAVIAVAVRFFATVVYRPAAAFPPDGLGWLIGVSIGYLVATAVVVIASYRRADATERRRLRVLLLGGGVGCVAGGPVVLAYWRTSHTTLFASPALALAVLLLLAVPLCFAYAILRHRLFDVRFIVRQGVRYALARRLLLSLVPALLAVLVLDVYLHRDRAIGEWFVGRAWVYLAVAGVALVAQFRRQRWLDALDRRFFRERYDAERLLQRVAADVATSPGFEAAAVRVVGQIDVALHPRFATVLTRAPGDEAFRTMATAPAGAGPTWLRGEAKVLALARALGKPLDVSANQSAWLAAHLPAEETAIIAASDLELVIPIAPAAGGSDALLVIGRKRSEEPYAKEDLHLLTEIGSSLSAMLSREHVRTGEAWAFGECPRCGACYDADTVVCAEEGEALATVRLPRLLAGRYRLDRRLGRGGMGIVYGAADISLAREVAVKLLREDMVGDRETAERFRREARISASFAHPHVVTIFDFGIAGDSRAFLVMERLHGRTLREELDRCGALEPPRVLHILGAVCSAVDAAHRRHLVHRDLKPENVFLARNDGVESPKVLDFGIAKVMPGGQAGLPDGTTTGLLIGTPQYMAPEQLRSEEAAPSWDIWALGLMAYEMLIGSHPFATLALGLAADGVPAADPSMARRAGIDAGWTSFFARALAIDPRARPGNAADFMAELTRACGQGCS